MTINQKLRRNKYSLVLVSTRSLVNAILSDFIVAFYTFHVTVHTFQALSH